jgi:ribonuclease P protein component
LSGYFGFQSNLRLTKPAEYRNVFADPVRSTDKYFTILAVKNNRNHPRLGLAIAKKNIRKAIDRNSIKRIIRESFRLSQHDLDGIDFVVLAKRPANQVLPQKLNQSLQRHWLKFKNRCDTYSSPS